MLKAGEKELPQAIKSRSMMAKGGRRSTLEWQWGGSGLESFLSKTVLSSLVNSSLFY